MDKGVKIESFDSETGDNFGISAAISGDLCDCGRKRRGQQRQTALEPHTSSTGRVKTDGIEAPRLCGWFRHGRREFRLISGDKRRLCYCWRFWKRQ